MAWNGSDYGNAAAVGLSFPESEAQGLREARIPFEVADGFCHVGVSIDFSTLQQFILTSRHASDVLSRAHNYAEAHNLDPDGGISID